MKVFAVCGIKKSGKTTVVTNIISELASRGYRVGSAKYLHHANFEMDANPQVDTRRHRDAGASLVCARAENETSLLFSEKLPMQKVLSFYEESYNWVVLEGGISEIIVPTIITAHNEDDILQKWSDTVFCVSGRIASSVQSYRGLPAFDATQDIKGLVDFIEARVSKWQTSPSEA